MMRLGLIGLATKLLIYIFVAANLIYRLGTSSNTHRKNFLAYVQCKQICVAQHCKAGNEVKHKSVKEQVNNKRELLLSFYSVVPGELPGAYTEIFSFTRIVICFSYV